MKTQESPTILIIEDEVDIREMLKFSLEAVHFRVIEAENANEARDSIKQQLPDLILLDWMLPHTSGIKLVRQLKADPITREIPLIMLTAKAEEENKVMGLESGVDDYITKPFSPRELVARIKAVLRRSPYQSRASSLVFGPLILNRQTLEASINGVPLNLSRIEYRLLDFFVTHPDKVYSRDQLLNHVWSTTTYIEERTVDVQILRLRKALAQHHCDSLIQTVYGIGYKMSEK